MPTIDEIINQEIKIEGDEKETTDPADRGGRTQFGVSEKSNPEAWKDGKVDRDEARRIFEQKYVIGPRFNLLPAGPVQTQLVDWGVNSGPGVAIMHLQKILGVDQDGIIGNETLKALANANEQTINAQLVRERVKMIGRIISRDPSQLKWINGWLDRATEFL